MTTHIKFGIKIWISKTEKHASGIARFIFFYDTHTPRKQFYSSKRNNLHHILSMTRSIKTVQWPTSYPHGVPRNIALPVSVRVTALPVSVRVTSQGHSDVTSSCDELPACLFYISFLSFLGGVDPTLLSTWIHLEKQLWTFFFHSWVSKTQPNHRTGTKRMANTRLVT